MSEANVSHPVNDTDLDPFDGDDGIPSYLFEDDRPVVKSCPELHAVVTQACAALANDAELYQRDGQLVRIVRVDESTKRAQMSPRSPQIRPVPLARLRKRLTQQAKFDAGHHATDSLASR